MYLTQALRVLLALAPLSYTSAAPAPLPGTNPHPNSNLALSNRDVWVPKVLYPHTGTVWKVGSIYNVTWDASDPPPSISNRAMVVLSKNGTLLDYEHPLAANFSLLLGRIEVQVPQVDGGDDYQIVLFGDSGNAGPRFTIES